MAEPVKIFEKEYYDRLKQIEGRHWWTLGMTSIMSRVVGPRGDGAGLVFLDVGCGSGIGLSWAAEHLPRARRLGIDVSEHALEHCRGLGAELAIASADKLPYPSDSVDLAICVDVLQHLPSHDGALAEVHRVLKPGGNFYVRTNARSLVPPPPGSRLYTVKELRTGLERAGLRVQTCSRVNLLGSLFAEVGLLRKSLRGGGHGSAEHHHDHAETGAGGEFRGGGYGGGLRLTAERTDGLSSRLKRSLLEGEAELVARGVPLPFGHSIVALATKT